MCRIDTVEVANQQARVGLAASEGPAAPPPLSLTMPMATFQPQQREPPGGVPSEVTAQERPKVFA